MKEYLETTLQGKKPSPVQFKYSPSMKSSYAAMHDRQKRGASTQLMTTDPRVKAHNIGHLKKELKVPFNPPHFLSTAYNEKFVDKKGSEEVGALTFEGFSPEPRRARPIG